ncbi:MAG: hypothetical protein AAGD32_13775 [Planctomycetota bacterium]
MKQVGPNYAVDGWPILDIQRTEEEIYGNLDQQTTDKDAVIDEYSESGIIRSGVVAVASDRSYRFINEAPSVGTINESTGAITRLTDGEFVVTVDDGLTRVRSSIDLEQVGGVPLQTIVSWSPGTFAELVSTSILNAVDNATPVETLKPTLSGGLRNPVSWPVAAGYNLGCIDTEKPNATVIGYSNGYVFVLQAEHYADSADTFVADDDTVYALTGGVGENVGPANSIDDYRTDFRVVRYTEPAGMAAKIPAALLPPATLPDYLPNLRFGVPVMSMDQDKNALIDDVSRLDDWVSLSWSDHPRLHEFRETKVAGDSGSPVFLLVGGGRLVIITTLTFGGFGRGPAVHANLGAIQVAVESLGGTWADFEFVDLAAYPSWP